MLSAVGLFIVGLLLLIKGGDWFVDGASGIAHKLHIPELLIGATVVSIGTTLPEVMVSAQAAVMGHGEISYGNAIGSVICNTALISAITLAVRPGFVSKKSLRTPVIFFMVAVIFYAVVAYVSGGFSREVGFALLAMFILYMIFTVTQAMRQAKETKGGDVEDEMSLLSGIALLVLGAVAIAVGADLLVDNGIVIAGALGVPESVIALTFIALGTSLPEFVTAIVALAKGHASLSVGNIIGANTFNIILVSGLAISIAPFDLPAGKMINGINASLVVDIPLMIFVMLLMVVPPLITGRFRRWQGILLLLLYVSFVTYQFVF